MSDFVVELSSQKSEPRWGEKAALSFSTGGAVIHINENAEQSDNIRLIQKAARQLDGLGLPGIKLAGSWPVEYQWAFGAAFGGAKRKGLITWCDDDNSQTLINRYRALQFTRDMVNATPQDLSPLDLAEKAAGWLQELAGEDITCKYIIGDELEEQGWTGIYNVGRGSDRPPVLLELDYNPSGNAQEPVSAALVGKGITFDSGGYSIKSSEGMLDMKCDMGGAATVAGGLGLAIMNGLQKRTKLFLCCAENLISGHAYKLGDVLTYKNGLSVEIVNTDAEGRLVLADGLMAASETGAPLIIDAATLTGAAVVALGTDYNGLFGLDTAMQQKMMGYAQQENELVWPLPLEKWHQDKCPSNFADTANSRPQKGGGAGGASNAAGFLSRFVGNEGKGWVHMDLASAYNSSSTAFAPAGGTGNGFRTISRALLEN